tara:strand:+ start:1441 stop:1662 length:222 start_codon:yes stop_codon:yes gene_type:complete
MTDNVNRPPHYRKGSVECIEAIKSALTKEEFKGYLKAAAIKYIWREDHKGKNIEDLQKAVWYLNRLIKELEEM